MTIKQQKSAFIATGLMLFALFFGAGNLIFPAQMGQLSGENVFATLAGFLLTGAGLPLLGVIAVGYSGSRDIQQLASRVTPWYGVLFAVLLYLSIGPFFAGPRTATVSFEIGVVPFLNDVQSSKTVAQVVFNLFFFALTYWLSVSPGKLVDRVGKVLTPVLLVAIAVLVLYAAFFPMGAPAAPADAYAGTAKALTKGFIDGYGTMDALASLVFAIIVIDAVRGMGVSEDKAVLSLTARAGFIAAGCLALVYIFIGYMGATSVAGIGLQENGAAILSKSAEHYFGATGKVLLAVIVFLACLSTSVGLVTACAEYFDRLLPKLNYRAWVVVFTLVTFVFANFGLAAIIKFSIPVLMLLYPLTVAIIALAFLDKLFGGSRAVYAGTILGTSLIAVINGWKTLYALLGGEDPNSLILRIDSALKTSLPLYEYDLGWLLPAAAGFCIGLIFKALRR